ncbi:hypothetical protein [Telmatospirillum sp.]|uniref:hypothetical protein n=1 Tax=Telmatospirillum sp. TaxID=2079197 RepID=UPI00284CCE8D|nr:hypothetical protein [Telmatospirillum sp.]MDR3438089.1 hypothetical protein [Telmatospirillum sp.]
MLFKGGTDTAAVVRPFAADPSGLGREDTALVQPPETSAALEALAAARAENEGLRARLQQIESEARAEVARAREAGRREAAAEHVRNDDAQLAELSAALVIARESFVAELQDSVQPLAAQLAGAALQRLVDMRRDDEDWLLRVVARRLADIDPASVIAVVLPESYRVMADQLEVPTGTTVVFEPSLPAGSARIDLRMGGVPIRIEEGLARVLAAFGSEHDPHG